MRFEEGINKLSENAVSNALSEEDLQKVEDVLENSKGTVGDKIINSANNNEENKKKIKEIIIKVVEKKP